MGNDIGIDLGTASVIVYDGNAGRIVLEEPSVVAVNSHTGQVLSVGAEAYQMLGKTPDRIRAVRPLANGVISDYMITEDMIKYFLKRACGSNIVKPRVAICVPSSITGVESQAVVDAAVSAGARKVYLIEEPVAAAIGAGLDITKPNGYLIVDIGGGTTDIAVLSLNGIVCKNSIRVAGNLMNEAIERYVRLRYNILIGDRTAQKVKEEIGSVCTEDGDDSAMEVKGRNLLTGLPNKILVKRTELIDPLCEPIDQIVTAIKEVLERTPPELSGDIYSQGIVMTGGGCLLNGLGEYISQRVKVQVRIAEDPIACVAIGTGKSFQYLDQLFDGFVNPSTHQH